MNIKLKLKHSKPAIKQDSDYPNILMLLGLANHPVPPTNEMSTLKARIDFRNLSENSLCNKIIDSNYYQLITQQLKNCHDVMNMTWHAPEVACIPDGGVRFVRYPHAMVELTKGYKVFIEILTEDAIDDKDIAEIRCLADELPSFGIRYLVVTMTQFNQCQNMGADK